MAERIWTSHSVAQTLELGECLGKAASSGDVLALFGGLGAGKTVLTKGIIRGLGGDSDQVTSPTFVLMVQHQARLALHHFDAYRLGGAREMLDIGAEEALYGAGITVVEWAERVLDVLPEDRLEAHLSMTGGTTREIRLSAACPRGEAWLRRSGLLT
jgi:tRNA threonylcarbamoyladenosine biosynthesis protein TsaE